MLDPNYFVKGYEKMCTIYSRELTPEQIQANYSYFQHMNEAQFKYAVEKHITEQKFFPAISELLNYVNELTSEQANLVASEIINYIYRMGTDGTIQHYKRRKEFDKVKLVERNYSTFRETLSPKNESTIKAQIREEYKQQIKYDNNEAIKKENPALTADFSALKNKMLLK